VPEILEDGIPHYMVSTLCDINKTIVVYLIKKLLKSTKCPNVIYVQRKVLLRKYIESDGSRIITVILTVLCFRRSEWKWRRVGARLLYIVFNIINVF